MNSLSFSSLSALKLTLCAGLALAITFVTTQTIVGSADAFVNPPKHPTITVETLASLPVITVARAD